MERNALGGCRPMSTGEGRGPRVGPREVRQSGVHATDLKSRNGVKVNGTRVTDKRLDPGDELSVAKHRYDVRYSPFDNGAVGPPPVDEEATDMMKQSLLERAGLEYGSAPARTGPKQPKKMGERYDILDDSEGQIKDPNRPV